MSFQFDQGIGLSTLGHIIWVQVLVIESFLAARILFFTVTIY